jgi:hypothetical protein
MKRRGTVAALVAVVIGLIAASPADARQFRLLTSLRGGVVRVLIAPNSSTAHWQAYLNGRDITDQLGYIAPAGRWVVISASNGVRFGKNKLVVVVRAPGPVRRIVRSFNVSRARPLAAAGPDVQVVGSARVSLSARGSRPAHAGSLVYRWQIVRRPARSKAKLLRTTSARPQLRTDLPGTYLLRLTVREHRPGGGLSPPSSDMVQVEQEPPQAKQGVFVAVEGLSPSAGTLRISGGPPLGGTFKVGTGAPSTDIAILYDRASMEPLPRAHPAPYRFASNAQGAETLKAAIAAAQAEAGALQHTVGLLLVATNAEGFSSAFGNVLTETVKVDGVPKVGAGTAFALSAVVGVAGTSWISVGSEPRQEFAGLLAPDNNGNFAFTPNDVPAMGTPVVSFATSPKGITVNGSTVPSNLDNPCEARGGYEVRILDAYTLADANVANNDRTFWTNSCNDNSGAVEAQRMYELIAKGALERKAGARLVIVQGVGVPQHANPEGNLQHALLMVSGEIKQLGGSAEAFLENPDALTGPSYALVGKNFQTGGPFGPSDSSPAQVTTAAPLTKKPEAALSGILTRDRRWRYTVGLSATSSALSGAKGAANLQLMSAAQTINATTLAPTAFPTSPNWLKMSDYTARLNRYGFTDTSVEDDRSSLCAPMPTPGSEGHTYEIDIRDLYCGGKLSEGNWATKAHDVLGNVRSGGQAPPSGVTRTEYEQFLEQLETEGALVDNVNNVIAMLTAPLGTQTVEAKVNLGEVDRVVNEAVAKAKAKQKEEFEKAESKFSFGSRLFLFGDLFDVGQIIAEFFSDGALPAIVGLAGGASDIAADLTNEKSGSPALGPFIPGTAVSSIGGELVASYRAFGSGLDQMRDLIVSDWARLQATKGISVSESETQTLEKALRVSGSQFVWRSVLATAFPPTRLVSSNYNPAPLDARNFQCPVWDEAPPLKEYLAMYFWRPWGKQGTFESHATDDNVFRDHNNLAPLEGTYIAAGGTEAFVLSHPGKGYPYKSYTNNRALPQNTSEVKPYVDAPAQNLPPGTFAPLFETPTKATTNQPTNGLDATPQGITKQLLFPELINAAEQAGQLTTLECVEPSQELGEHGDEWESIAEHSNRVPVGQPVTEEP